MTAHAKGASSQTPSDATPSRFVTGSQAPGDSPSQEQPPSRSVSAPNPISKTGHAPTRSEQVLVRLTPSELTDLDRLAAQTGLSRQQILRAGLTLFTATETAHA